MTSEEEAVLEHLKRIPGDPDSLDKLIGAWNSLCRQRWIEQSDDLQFAEIDSAALAVFNDKPSTYVAEKVDRNISRLLSTFPYPTLLVNASGLVQGANVASLLEFDIDIGSPINDLPFLLEGSKNLSGLIAESLASDDFAESSLRRVYVKDTEQMATMAITLSRGKSPSALVFVITSRWVPKSWTLFKQQFKLTSSEIDVLTHFVNGLSLQNIADRKGRSYATIRTQFQSLLNKTHSSNQAELLRTALSVSDFVNSIGVVTDAIDHPHRRKAEILRDNGRVVEVTMMGDFNGQTIVTIASPPCYTFNADFEQKLYDAGLRVISICSPRYGNTDIEPQGMDRLDCITQDVVAVMDQLSVRRFTLMLSDNSGPACYRIAASLPERVLAVVAVSQCGPVEFSRGTKVAQPWVEGIVNAHFFNKTLKRFLIRGIARAWVMMGAERFVRLQMAKQPIDKKYALRNENITEYQMALDTASKCGLSAITDDIELVLGDFLGDIKATRAKIYIVHGTLMEMFTLGSIKSLVAECPNDIELITVNGAGFTLIHSHPHIVVDTLLRAINEAS